MWVLLVIAAAVLLSSGSTTTTSARLEGRAPPPDRETARLYQAMCEFWREGIYEPRALTLATVLAVRPEKQRTWEALADGGAIDRGNADHRYWELVSNVADEVVARPSLLCNRGGS